MDSKTVRKKFIEFFEKKKHKFVPPISLVPENDPTLLFTNSGMVQFKNYFLGMEKPKYNRMVNYQPSFRTIDIEKVGTNDRTLTFFEMLGSWSIGDYWKEDAIKFAWELLTKEFGFPKEKLWVTVFGGSNEVPSDNESINYWLEIGVPKERIVKLGEDDNFWIAGDVGPCGPSTEIYFDQGKHIGCGKPSCKPGCDCDRFLEIWNAGVFMQYEKKLKIKNLKLKINEYEYAPLKIKSVDTGAGLERIAAILQDKDSVFEIDLFKSIINEICNLIGCQEGAKESTYKSIRIIADHIRGSVFLISDGINPSNKTQGYVLRRLIRRMIVHGRLLGINDKFIAKLAGIVIDTMQEFYPHLIKEEKRILEILNKEESNFNATLDRGLREFQKVISYKLKVISGKDAFLLYDSFGFPLELTMEMAKDKNIKVDEKGYYKELESQREKARSANIFGAKKEINPRLHTATHLLHQALNDVLGDHVQQAGSDVSGDELRFDFTHPEKLTDIEKKKVEDIVNDKIDAKLTVNFINSTLEEAKKQGAKALFMGKYGQEVRLYYIGKDLKSAYSKELCAGPHVTNTKEIGKFIITQEKSSSQGVRRIKAKID
jgi:alanyl-tRNA synthetase